MKKKNKFSLLPKYSDPLIVVSIAVLTIYGFFMIMSAEMGESSADINIISSVSLKQILIVLISIVSLVAITHINWDRLTERALWYLYGFMFFALLIPRGFSPVGGAYAWIRLGPLSIQPSEFAKVFIIYFGARLLGNPNEKFIKNKLLKYSLAVLIYVGIIMFVEKDFGSAFVLMVIGYIMVLIPPNKELRKIQNILILVVIAGIGIAVFLLSKTGTKLLSKFNDNYMIARFLSSANPFEYQFDSGYHLVMSLVSFATGGLFGVGYTKSIHKYMNFPNPSTDFILPVIVEEMGIIFGLLPIIIFYGIIIGLLIYHSRKSTLTDSKMVITGAYVYLVVHFILNVGGVSGLIPLTGVPLLLISSGGSSLWAYYCAIGFVEYEIVKYRKKLKNENSSREI